MPSLKDLKNRIESVKSTRKITKAMQMVAAAKLRRAQDAAEMARPYAERFNAVMSKLAASVGDSESAPKLLRGTGSDQTHLLVVMTAERGLCGGFNSNIAKLARTHAERLKQDGKTVKILTVGKKGRDHDHYGFTCWLAGGGVRGGQAYGATDEFGFRAVENPVHVHDLHATILHLAGFDHEQLTFKFQGRHHRLTDVHGQVVRPVLS